MPQVITEADLEAAIPDFTSPRCFPNLRDRAVIRRDPWGIPHIKAEHEYDVFFAQGFATAQDRLFQMDLDRLRSAGRSAEYLGSGALQQDRYLRRRRLERVSKLDYALATPATKNVLDAYTDGVNAFLDTAKSLPVEYKLLGTKPERWEPWHCIAVFKVRNTAEGTFQGKLWLSRLAAQVGVEKVAKLSPGYQPGSLLAVPPGTRYQGPILHAIEELHAMVEASSALKEIDGGSNGWAIAGDRTESKLPLVAGDSHRGLEAPNVYSQVHLIGPDFAVLGFALPGFPMALHFCHNEHVAWAMTAGGIDTQDLFVERFRESNGQLEYLYRDRWLRADTTLETLRSRGGEDEEIEIVETHTHGPVIAGHPRQGAAITLADPGSKDATPWIDAAYRAMKARSGGELQAALAGWTDRVNNYIYADVQNNFGYALRGRIPIRGSENGWGPVAGWTGEHEWQGYIPVAQLPAAHNPEAGWVVSCNQRVVDETYPYYLTNFCSTGYRSERIAQRIADLEDRQKHRGCGATIQDMLAIHADVVSIPAQSMQKALARALPLSGRAAAAAKALLVWDCKLTTESSAAALYEMTAVKLTERLAQFHYASMAEELLKSLDAGAEEHWRRNLKAALFVALEQDDESWLPAGESWRAVLSQALESAVEELEGRFSRDWAQWRWGDLHYSAQQHPLALIFPDAALLLNPPPIETMGDGDTPCVTAPRTGADFVARLGSVNRYVHDPADWSKGVWIVPLGASGHPGSAHYADQQKHWGKAQAIPQLWDWEQIGREAETEQRLARYPVGSL